MEHLSKLIGYTVVGPDSEQLGVLRDIYLEEDSWIVKYFAVDHSRGLQGESSLLPPPAVVGANATDKTLITRLSREQLDLIPTATERKTVSNVLQEKVADKYGWIEPLAGTRLFRFATSRLFVEELEEELGTKLRSVSELLGYSVQVADDCSGKISDFVVEHHITPWEVSYFAVSVNNVLGSNETLMLPAEQFNKVEWLEKKVELDSKAA